MSISEAESGLTTQQYADIQAEFGDLAVDVVLQRYGPVWTQHDTEGVRTGDNFDAAVAGAYLLRAYTGALSDLEVERLADESGGDESWASVATGTHSDIDIEVPPSLVTDGLTARVFHYTTGGQIKYIECADISSGTFGAAQAVGTVADVIFLAAVSTTKVYYITENTNHNRVLHVYENTGSWVNTDSDIYWPYSIKAFDAVTFETGRDLLTFATNLPPLVGSRVIGAEVTQEVNQVQGIVSFWVANGRWSDHSKVDVIDRIDTDPSRSCLRQTLNNSLLFTTYLRCGGTEAYPYSKAAVGRSADGQNWEFPELIESLMPPYAILARSDYLYAVGVNKVLRSPCCAWAGQTPVEYDLTEYVLGMESTAADIRSSQVTVSNPADVLATTLAKSDDRLQAKYKLGYVVGGASLLMQVSLEDVVERAEQAALPKLGLALTTRDFLGRVNRVRSDYAAEWPNMQAGHDTYNDPSGTGYGGLRHTAPYEGSWKTPGGEEIHLLSKNREGLAVSTLVTGALNGSAETAFQVNTAGNSEYAGITFRVFDKDNLHYFIYDQDTDKLKLIQGAGTDDDGDDERDNTTLATSDSVMSWSVDTWYWLKIVVRYSLVYAFYSTDGITWVAVTWAGGGGTDPIELAGASTRPTDQAIGSHTLSGRFGLIGYGYSANDSWPPYTPPPWVPPVLPEGEIDVVMLVLERTDTSARILCRTTDFTSAAPTWGLTLTGLGGVGRPVYRSSLDADKAYTYRYANTWMYIYRIDDFNSATPAETTVSFHETIGIDWNHSNMGAYSLAVSLHDAEKIAWGCGNYLSNRPRFYYSVDSGVTMQNSDQFPSETQSGGNNSNSLYGVCPIPGADGEWYIVEQCGWFGPYYSYHMTGKAIGSRSQVHASVPTDEPGQVHGHTGSGLSTLWFRSRDSGAWTPQVYYGSLTNVSLAGGFNSPMGGPVATAALAIFLDTNQLKIFSGGSWANEGDTTSFTNPSAVVAMSQARQDRWAIGRQGGLDQSLIKYRNKAGWVDKTSNLWTILTAQGWGGLTVKVHSIVPQYEEPEE